MKFETCRDELLGNQGKLSRDDQQWQNIIWELDAETMQKLNPEIIEHEAYDEDRTRNITVEIHFNLKPLPEPMGDSEPTTEYNMHEQAGPLTDCGCAEKCHRLLFADVTHNRE